MACPPAAYRFSVDTHYILGMANMEGAVKILLDIDRVMTAEEIAEVEKAA